MSAIDEFLTNVMGGGEVKEPPNPNETLISNQMLGIRPYNKRVFSVLTIISSTVLLITLTEKIPVLRNLAILFYVFGIAGMALFDVGSTFQKHGYLRQSQIGVVAAVYGVAAIFLFLLVQLIMSV